MSDLVEATPKRSADCFLDVKPRPPDDALGRVGEARSAVGEWVEGGKGQHVFGRLLPRRLISVHNVSGLGFGGSRPLEAPHCHLFDLMFKCLKLSVTV